MKYPLVLGQSSHATLVFPVPGSPLGRTRASAGADFFRTILAASLPAGGAAGLGEATWTQTDRVVRFSKQELPEGKGERVTIEHKDEYDYVPVVETAKREAKPAKSPEPDGLVWVIDTCPKPRQPTVLPAESDKLKLIVSTAILPLADHHTRPRESAEDAQLWSHILGQLGGRQPKLNFLLTSADAFRRAGYRTREEGSMSATVEDICATVCGSDSEPGNLDGRDEFKSFGNIFVRLRGDGVLHLAQETNKEKAKKEPWQGTLYYSRESNVDDWTGQRGRHYGVDALLTACIARWAADPEPSTLKEAVGRVWLLVAKGSVLPRKEGDFATWARDLWRWTQPPAPGADKTPCAVVPFASEPPCKVAGKKQPKCSVEHIGITLALTRERNRWSLLEECISHLQPPRGSWPFGILKNKENRLAAQTQLYARHVASEGYETPWGRRRKDKDKEENWAKSIDGTPAIKYFTLGALKTVDRAEVEGLSGLKRLIHGYPGQLAKLEGRPEKPLCLAVFGAPGSGKSFGVTEIAKSLAEQSDPSAGLLQISKRILEFNVSQFTELGDLAKAMQDIREERLAGKIPVVIFDEFDSTFGGQGFGWLKYFLMPMQDGKFRNEQTIYRTGGCIMVFAGGINHNFAEFTGRQRDKDFAVAKGPDFISRLRGVLNIPSMTRDDSQGFPLWQIRRAGLINQYLRTKGAEMHDLRLLDALLTVGRFHHGARSLEAIIQMCDKNAQGQIDLTSLPRREQLDLHVDANEFWSLIMAEEPPEKG